MHTTLINSMLNLPFGSDVYVIPDSEYQKLHKTSAERQISRLEKKLESYEYSADRVRQRIADLQTEHGLLPEAANEAAE